MSTLSGRNAGVKKALDTQSDGKSFEQLRHECLQKGVLFEDPDFPAADSSLFYSQSVPVNIEWKRPRVCRPALDASSRLPNVLWWGVCADQSVRMMMSSSSAQPEPVKTGETAVCLKLLLLLLTTLTISVDPTAVAKPVLLENCKWSPASSYICSFCFHKFVKSGTTSRASLCVAPC